ncbi:MAG: hypothetical protein ACI8S6_005513, partial [Myxococcota bacterium]
MPVWIWLSLAPTAAGADTLLRDVCAAWPDAEQAASAEEALAHAETYYWWARGAGNSVEMHCRSLRSYEAALHLAEEADDTDAGSIAAAGLEQVRWRVDNSFDVFRNIYPLAWWLLGEDTVVEPEDGPGALPDFYGRAAEQAWLSMQAVLDDSERPRTLAIIRCGGDAESCPGLRDVLSILADDHPRLATIPDDRGVAFIGAGPWAALTSGDTPALSASESRAAATALRAATGFDEVVLVEADIADTVSAPAAGVRVELAADVWALPADQQRRIASGTGVGADLVPRRDLDLAWMGVVMLLGVALSPLRHLARPPGMEEESSGLSMLQAALGMLIGSLLGLFARRLTGPLAPEMTELALNPWGALRLTTLLWPLAHGALLLIGPLVVSVFLVFGVMPRVNASLAERLDLGLLTLSIQCGVLALALAPIPAGAGLAGLLACAAMSAPALAVAAILGERIEQIRGLVEVEPRRQVAPVLLAVAGLVAGLPA